MSQQNSEPPEVFVSYASEQRREVARPLAEILSSLGIRVWYDEFELRLGDSLHRSIDRGLAECRFGVVILSHDFFAKHHTQRELEGLAQREVAGQKVLIPIWYDVDEHDVRRYSPPLADRIAARWKNGIYSVVDQILQKIRPDLTGRVVRSMKAKSLFRLRSGKELAAIVGGAHLGYIYNDEPTDSKELEMICSAAQEVRDWGEQWSGMEPGEHIQTEFRLTQLLRELESAGWTAFGRRYSGRKVSSAAEDALDWYHFALLRGEPHAVMRVENGIAVIRNSNGAT